MPIVIIIILTTSPMVLLEWLLHLLNIPQQHAELGEQEVIVLIRRALLKIDAEYFRQLKDDLRFGYSQDQDYLQIFTQIASFLTEKDFKKLNCKYEKEVLANRSTEELISLVLYVAVNSTIKKEVIQQILDCSADQQCEIMRNIQQIESRCQKITELKKIVEKIENIEQQNEALRTKIAISEQRLHHQLDQIQQIQAWNTIIAKQNAKYEEQKQAAFKQLDVTRLQQFAEICYINRQQNIRTAASLQAIEGDREFLFNQNIKLKKQLKNCGETIQRQIKEIEELKCKCKNLSQQYWLTDYMYIAESSDIPLLPLSDNKNVCNIDEGFGSEKRKLPTDRTECSSRREELEQSFEIKSNLHVLLSLQELQRQEKEKIHQIQQMKYEGLGELARQRKLDRKIRKIRGSHKFFMGLYEETKVIKA